MPQMRRPRATPSTTAIAARSAKEGFFRSSSPATARWHQVRTSSASEFLPELRTDGFAGIQRHHTGAGGGTDRARCRVTHDGREPSWRDTHHGGELNHLTLFGDE